MKFIYLFILQLSYQCQQACPYSKREDIVGDVINRGLYGSNEQDNRLFVGPSIVNIWE
jgi:hypothetical protein